MSFHGLRLVSVGPPSLLLHAGSPHAGGLGGGSEGG
jgi:hypothetical protein